jgi:Icc-related predicted phosphoesterase
LERQISVQAIKLLMISDIHAQFERFAPSALPDADLILIAGDLTNNGIHEEEPVSPAFREWLQHNTLPPDMFYDPVPEVERAREWLRLLAQRAPVFWIPGNHDIDIDNTTFADIPNCTGILDKTVEVAGLRIHGVSCSPGDSFMVNMWAYMTQDWEEEQRAYDFEAVDIVLSHCPPYGGSTDRFNSIEGQEPYHFGSRALGEYIERHSPRLVVCGHVHEGARYERIGATDIINCALRWEPLSFSLPD